MGKHNARRTRRRPESAAAARGVSSREGYQASGTLEVSPPPAWHSAPPRCRLRISVAFSSLSCLRCARPRILGGDDLWRIDGLLTRKVYRNGCIPKAKPTLTWTPHQISSITTGDAIRPRCSRLRCGRPAPARLARAARVGAQPAHWAGIRSPLLRPRALFTCFGASGVPSVIMAGWVRPHCALGSPASGAAAAATAAAGGAAPPPRPAP